MRSRGFFVRVLFLNPNLYKPNSQVTEFNMRINLGKVLIAGCGGTGTEIAKLLISFSFDSLLLVDHDTIAMNNLHRQFFYRKSDVGKFKSQILYERFLSFYSAFSGSSSIGDISKNVEYHDCNLLNKVAKKCVLKKNYDWKSDFCIERKLKMLETTGNPKSVNMVTVRYFVGRLEEIDDSFDVVFCCVDSISSRMSCNLLDFGILIDTGVSGNMCHVKKIKKGFFSCLNCISYLYEEERAPPCTTRNLDTIHSRSDALKHLIDRFPDETVIKKFNICAQIKNWKNTTLFEVEGIRNGTVANACYINAICASLAYEQLLSDSETCFIFYNDGYIASTNLNRSEECIVCKDKWFD